MYLSVPGWVLQYIAKDNVRDYRVGVTHTNVGTEHLVLGTNSLETVQQSTLRKAMIQS